MTLIGRAWFAEGLARKKINLDHARMELRDLREIMPNDHTASKGG
jgi:hypothetical protein